MRKHFMVALIVLLPFSWSACSGEGRSSHPKTPTAVVAALLKQVRLMKAASQKAREQGSSGEAAGALAKSKTDLNSLFLSPDKAKLMMMPLLMVKSGQVDFIDEQIKGDKAEVTIEHTITGIGILTKPEGLPPERRQLTFQLQKEGGRWLVADIGGVLASYGR